MKQTRTDLVLSDYGILLYPNGEDLTFQFYVSAAYGHFYSNYLRAIREPFVLLDVGANQGLYSLVAAQNTFCKQVISLEPVAETFDLLSRNISANGLSQKIVALNCGLSARDEVATISTKPGHSGAASLHVSFENGLQQQVKLASSAAIASLIVADLPVVVKIDTEGHESVVIEELCQSTFANRIVSVFYEMNLTWSDPAAIELLLRTIGIVHFQRVAEGDHQDINHYDIFASRQPSVSQAR